MQFNFTGFFTYTIINKLLDLSLFSTVNGFICNKRLQSFFHGVGLSVNKLIYESFINSSVYSPGCKKKVGNREFRTAILSGPIMK